MAGRKRTLAPRKGTHLPNASTLGYGEYIAHPGDYVLVGSNGQDAFGRVLGQITECDFDGTDCRGYLAVAIVSNDLTFGYERWIAPGEVLKCWNPKHTDQFMACFMASTVRDIQAGLDANSGILAAGNRGKVWAGPDDQIPLEY